MQRYFIIWQYLGNQWVELTKVPVEGNPSSEEIKEGLEEVKKMIFDSDKVNFILENELVIFRPIDGPVKVECKYD